MPPKREGQVQNHWGWILLKVRWGTSTAAGVTSYSSRSCLLKILFLTILTQAGIQWNVQNIRYPFLTLTCPALWSCSKILQETACISAFIQLFPMRKSWNFLFALSLIHSNLTFLGSLVKPSLSSPLSVWRSSGEQDRTSAWEMRLPHCMQKEELLYSQAKLLGSEGGSFFLCWSNFFYFHLPFTHVWHHSSHWCARALSSHEPPEELRHDSNPCMCPHWHVCLHCFGVDSSWGVSVSEIQLAMHWGREAGGKHKVQLTCLPSVLQQVVTGSLRLQTSSSKGLDKWSQTSSRCWKEQLQWFIFPNRGFVIDFKVSIGI